MRTRRSGWPVLVAALAAGAAGAVIAPHADALPRYSARYEQKCALCHVNPSGGGLRNAYASERLVPEEIAWHRSKPAIFNTLDSTLAKFIQIGADFREVYVGSTVQSSHLNFFQMQSDLYLNLQFDDRVSLYMNKSRSDTYEVFGLGYLTPHLYAKAGRFVPSYGWKFDDHTMFVRDQLGLAPPGNADVGLEVGYSPGRVDVQLGVVNGAPGSILDTNTRLAGVMNVVARHRLGPFGVALGGSGYHKPGGVADFDTYGGYGYLTWRNFTWVGETDFVRRKPNGGDAVIGLVASHELTWLVRQGFEIKAIYDFYDPDRDFGPGSKSRYGGGVVFMPYPYLALDCAVRRTVFDDGLFYAGTDATETVLQLHLFR